MAWAKSALRWWGRIFAAEWSASTPMIGGLAVCLVALLMGGLLTSTAGMLPGWGDPLNLILTACLYLAPLGCGVAALHMAALEQDGAMFIARTSPRGESGPVLLGWLAVLTWQILALAIFATLVLLRSNMDGAGSWAMAILPIQALALMFSCTAFGAFIGRVWPSRLSGPVAAAGVFVPLYLLALADGRAHGFSPVYSEIYYQVYLQPNVALVGSVTLILLAVGAATLAMSIGLSGKSLLIGLGAPFLIALLGVTINVIAEASPVELRAAPKQAECDQADGISLCVWPESENRLREGLVALNTAVRAVQPFFPKTPVRFYETGLRPVDAGNEFQLPRVGDPSIRFTTAMAIFPPPDCDSQEATQAHSELVRWLMQRVSPGASSDPLIRSAVKLPPAQQREWVLGRASILINCS